MTKQDRRIGLQLTRTVPFGHCDPAGILYTPRALDYCLEALDTVWKVVLDGLGWFELNVDHDRGTPFVNVQLDFRSPVTARALLSLTVILERVGTTSANFSVQAAQSGRPCFEAHLTSVLAVKSTMSKVSPDDWLRKKIQAAWDGEIPALLLA